MKLVFIPGRKLQHDLSRTVLLPFEPTCKSVVVGKHKCKLVVEVISLVGEVICKCMWERVLGTEEVVMCSGMVVEAISRVGEVICRCM
jgi:hypothetical protein